MFKVFKYSSIELLRNRWFIAYAIFNFIITYGFLYLGGEHIRAQASMMNVVILMVPLVTLIFGLMYMYQVRDYAELLLSQPISRKAIFVGYYLSLGTTMSLAVLSGVWLALAFSYLTVSVIYGWVIISIIATLLTIIFSGIACYLAIKFENRLVGFGAALFVWMFLAIIYDGIFLMLLLMFEDYPLENFALISTLLNPIDMGRVLIIFQLDFGALMGYTGAVFKKFFGSSTGTIIIFSSFLIWCLIPFALLLKVVKRKDF